MSNVVIIPWGQIECKPEALSLILSRVKYLCTFINILHKAEQFVCLFASTRFSQKLLVRFKKSFSVR